MKNAFCSKVAGSLLLSAGLFASGAVFADTTLTFDAAGNAIFGALHATGGMYDDVYLFDIDETSYASGTAVVGKTWIDGTRLANYGITDVQFFWQDDMGVRTDLDTVFSAGGSIDFYPSAALASGTYGFMVTGSTTNGGSYAGTLNIAAVPEPATYAMLGIGIGLLAFTARRKTNNKLG
jgi:hypothetical protein